MSAEPLEHVELGTVVHLATLMQRAVHAPLTVNDLLVLDATEVGRMELIDGSMYVTPVADLDHQNMVVQICAALMRVVPKGLVVLPGCNVIMDSEVLTIPDVAVVDPAHHVHNGLGIRPKGLILGVEVTSPSTRRRDLTLKRDLYAEWQVPLVIIDRKAEPYQAIVHGRLPRWAKIIFNGSLK